MKTQTIFLLLILLSISNAFAQDEVFKLTKVELEKMYTEFEKDTNLAKFIGWHGNAEDLYYKYKRNVHNADSIWEADQAKLGLINIGETETLEIIPLVDWFTANDSLIGENGAAYLIKTDEATILFDLGLNPKGKHPSPLLHNMKQLGITMDDIDIIVISHNHPDHVGGPKWSMENSFSLTNYQMDLNNVPVYTPNEMTYPGITPKFIHNPTKIAKGVSTIGVIHNPIFLNNIAEQALAINVKGKGIVIISGCGHQSFEKIMARTDVLFKEPIYGLIGGFHFPMAEERNITWIYKYFVVNKMPWERLTEEDITQDIKLLKSKGVKTISISGHDSCDKSINLFKNEFGANYTNLVVGEKITIEK